MIAYKLLDGFASDLRCVSDDYKPQPDERTLPGWDLPPLDSLHDPVMAEKRAAEQQWIREVRAIEAGQDARTLRAAILGDPVALAKLRAVEDAIVPLRAQRPK